MIYKYVCPPVYRAESWMELHVVLSGSNCSYPACCNAEILHSHDSADEYTASYDSQMYKFNSQNWIKSFLFYRKIRKSCGFSGNDALSRHHFNFIIDATCRKWSSRVTAMKTVSGLLGNSYIIRIELILSWLRHAEKLSIFIRNVLFPECIQYLHT